tara:strand:- start:370 stop:732 length:363 start_codon:yes stop_codon:yes gene_type:complete
MKISYNEYWKECRDLAQELLNEIRQEQPELDQDELLDEVNDRLHQQVDGHKWVIYYAYNLDVINHSDNEDYMIDNNGEDYACEVLKNSGLNGLHSNIAYWAMYADVSEHIYDLIEQLEVA